MTNVTNRAQVAGRLVTLKASVKTSRLLLVGCLFYPHTAAAEQQITSGLEPSKRGSAALLSGGN